MKTIKTITIAIFLLISNFSQAQSILAKEITVNENITNTYKLIEYLEKETGYSINYSESVLKIYRTIKLKQTKGTFKYFLYKIFEQQQVTYIIKQGKILVKPKTSTKNNKTSLSKEHFLNIKGKVTEKQSGEAIAYATISIKNKAIGTVTNTEGSFVFHIPKKYKNDSLVVSSIGYKSYVVKINEITNKKLTIQLKKKVYDLLEVDVKPKDALEIIKQAIAKIPENYPTEPINMEGFYREMTFENDTCVEMAEAACEFYYRPQNEVFDWRSAMNTLFKYSESHFNYFMNSEPFIPGNPDDKLNIIEGRSSKLFHKNHLIVVPRGGPLLLTTYDIVKTKYILFKNRLLKKFIFKIEDITSYQNKQVYVISFVDTRGGGFYVSGRLYIDINSLAFIKFIFNISSTDKRKYTAYWTPALYKKKKRRCKDLYENYKEKIVVNYKNIGDKWYLNNVNKSESFDYTFSKHYIHKATQPKFRYTLDRNLLINKHITNNVKKISDDENFANSFYSILYEHDLDYNPAFWENYNIIKTTPLQDSIIKQLELYQPLEEQFEEQFIKIDSLPAPVAKIKECIHPYTKLKDNYYWMQNIKNPDVLKYVKAENKYTENYMLSLKMFRRKLYSEILKRVKRDTNYVPVVKTVGKYKYYYRKKEDTNTENLYRRNTDTKKEELVIDIERLTKENNKLIIEDYFVHQNNKLIAYIKHSGLGYENSLVIMNIKTKKKLNEIENVAQIIWKTNEEAFYYLTWDDSNRLDKLWYHKLNTKQKNDKLVYYEKNKQKEILTFTHDKRWCILSSEDDFHYNTTHLFDLKAKDNRLIKIVNAKEKHTDYINILKDTIYSLSKENGKSTIYYSSIYRPQKKYWQVLIQNPKKELWETYSILKDYIVIKSRNKMVYSFKIYSKQGKFIKDINFEEASFEISQIDNKKILAKNKFRYSYSSLITPQIIYEYDIVSGKQKIIKQQKIKGYNIKKYKTELIWATSKDGIKVPISLVYNKKKSKINRKSPLYLTTYGIGGGSSTSDFRSDILSLTDRGVIYAIAHVRGGRELGKSWHEDAMRLKKKNTFNDFIACAEHLIENKYTSKGNIIAEGGSGGGLVMGTVANQKPDLFNTVLLFVPYVDVLSAMTDSTVKFYSVIRAELGNPNKPEVYNYIKSYSPYQNIKKQDYPNMLYYIGLNDNRVEYWQSLKSVAKLRALKTDNNKLFLKTELYVGHNGYADYSSVSYIYAYVLNNLGIKY